MKANTIFSEVGIAVKGKNYSMNSQNSANSQESDQTAIHNCPTTPNIVEQPQFDTVWPDDAFLALLARDLTVGAYNQPNTGGYADPITTINGDGTAQIILADGRVIEESSQNEKTIEILGILCTVRSAFDMRKTEILQCMLFMRRLLTKGRVVINPWSVSRLLIGGLILSIKVNRDRVPSNSFVAQVLGISYIRVNEWERSTYEGLEYEVGVNIEEYTQLEQALHSALIQ
ncbi:MAG: hypothetical protein EZS28_006927 [Streblomastix strix]|uniref:Uncharacterized protein n=1 Tax=Streblomastix strix TaxID=222440 RepID=A0A5J4WQY7_9EUKA|nr:MAG: hypothetical protein EZS28_006927 [Streblomastix strix]